jgi:hypothetical protein
MPPAKIQTTPRRVSLPVMNNPPPEAVSRLFAGFEEPRCIWCGRLRSQHAEPVDLGDGTFMVPACETVNGGGKYGKAERLPRPLRERLEIAMTMPLQKAQAIAGTLGQPSKMPGAAYGIDAFQCRAGGALVDDPSSTCHGCYARRNFYRYWHAAVAARAKRQAAIRHPLWIEAMIALIMDYIERGGEPAFRWHDSGDLHGPWHLAAICAVAEATPHVRQWLPTREYDDVVQYLRAGGVIPPNLTVRLSAHYVGKVAEVPAEIAHLPTSTTHHKETIPPVKRKGAIVCHAIDSPVNMCRGCRACWDRRVTNVSYRMH